MVGGEEGWVKLIGDGSGWGWVLRVRGRLRGGWVICDAEKLFSPVGIGYG